MTYKQHWLMLIIVTVSLGGCVSHGITITGNYVLEEGISRRDIGIKVAVIEDGQTGDSYAVRLLRNGKFRVSIGTDAIPENDELHFVIYIAESTYPRLVAPYISTELRVFTVPSDQGEIEIDTFYVSRVLRLESITSSTRFRSQSEVGFEWRDIPFADFYDIGISKLNSESEYEAVWSSHNLRDNKFRLAEANTYRYIEGRITPEDLESIGPFNRLVGPLEPGEYRAGVSAYRFETREHGLELVVVGETSSRSPFEFTIE